MNDLIQWEGSKRSPKYFRRGKVEVITAEEIAERFNGFQANEQQLYAINTAVNWYRGWINHEHAQQVFCLTGYAGTGKTSCAAIIAELCVGSKMVTYIAPTGKAAARLREKGCFGARTLHQFIYRYAGENDELDPIFLDKGSLDVTPQLVIMDESSMVGEYDERNLLSKRLPVLALYDPGQVPPVKARQVFDKERADIILDKIERNAGNIVRASMFIRDGKRLPPREYDDFVVRRGSEVSDEDYKTFLDDDSVIICATNSLRQKCNRRARRLLGFDGLIPGIGEKIVATANQHAHGIMNGEQCVVLAFKEMPEGCESEDWDEMLMVQVRMLGTGYVRWVEFNPVSWDEDPDRRAAAMKSAGGFDYGYALTIHKSQGSEWLRGLIYEGTIPGCPYSQMMYTAITRFIKFVRMQLAS